MSNVLNGIRPLLGDHRKAHRAVGVALAVPTVLVVLCCGYIGWAYAEGRSRTVWLVNGLDRDYDVNLNGRTVHLDAFSQQRIRIAEGEIHVRSVDHSLPLAEQSCEIDTPLLTRPFDQTTFVINPDRAALLYEDQTLYATDIREARDSDQRHYFTGELLYRVSGVDYAFAPFPETVKVSGGRVQKKRLALLSEGDEFHRLRLIANEISRDAATEYACTQALCYPDDRQALMVALSRMQPPDAMKFLRAGLDHRPVWLVWHRMYQETSQRMRPEFDLAGEYRGLLAAEPKDATLMYLLGRVTPDDAERDKLFQQSTRGSKPCAFGFFALAYEALAQGDFEPALQLIDKAMSLAPNQEQFRGVKIESLGGLGRFDELLKMLGDQEATDPMNQQVLLAKVRLLACAGRLGEAHHAMEAYLARASRPENRQALDHLQVQAEALLEYTQGDQSGFARDILQAVNSPTARFEAAVCQGHLDEAAAALSVDPTASAGDHLLLYILGTLAHRPELASEHLKVAISGYRMGGTESMQAAQYLCGAEPINPDAACRLALLPRQKKVVLVAFALQDPGHRQQYLQLADKLNYDRIFPYWTLRQVVRDQLQAR